MGVRGLLHTRGRWPRSVGCPRVLSRKDPEGWAGARVPASSVGRDTPPPLPRPTCSPSTSSSRTPAQKAPSILPTDLGKVPVAVAQDSVSEPLGEERSLLLWAQAHHPLPDPLPHPSWSWTMPMAQVQTLQLCSLPTPSSIGGSAEAGSLLHLLPFTSSTLLALTLTAWCPHC